MKQKFLSLVLLTSALAAVSASALTGFDPDYDAARERAKANGRPMLVLFTGSDWCGWCIKLEKEVFSQPEFLSAATNEFELVVLDFPSDKTKQPDAQRKRCSELSDKFKVRGFPTVKVLKAADESVVCESGYAKGGPVKWLEGLRKEMKFGKLAKESLGPLRAELDGLYEGIRKALRSKDGLPLSDEGKREAIAKAVRESLPSFKALSEKVKGAKIPAEIEDYRKELQEDVQGVIEWIENSLKKAEAK